MNFIQQLLEPARQYKFNAIFFKNSSILDSEFVELMGMSVIEFNSYLILISSLIKSVRQIATKIDYSSIELGSVSIPMPFKVVADPFEVVFLEDSSQIVSKFYYMMFEKIKSNNLKWKSFNQLSFSFILMNSIPFVLYNKTGLLGVKSNVRTNSNMGDFSKFMSQIEHLFSSLGANLSTIAQEIPAKIDFYPNVFPISITQTELNKSGNDFFETTLTFIRIPKIIEKFK